VTGAVRPTVEPVRPALDAAGRDAALAGAGATPVFVHYTSASCGPCARFAPTVARFAAHGAGRWAVVSVDLDDDLGAGARHGIRSVPTVVVVVDGVVRARLTGVRSEAELCETAERFTTDAATTIGDERG
jgi:putative thioredoxin